MNVKVTAWVPVLFGITTPITFAFGDALTKHLVQKKIHPFDPSNLSFTTDLFTNLVVLAFGCIPYWLLVEFSPYLFYRGLIGSMINTAGVACIVNAMGTGPQRPVGKNT